MALRCDVTEMLLHGLNTLSLTILGLINALDLVPAIASIH
jgi:hypothetical protein